MSLEDLMTLRVQQVFGAGDRLQPVTEVPSSVSIVTRDEISRYGYRTLADILRGVRGFYVTDDRNYKYIGARGFNRPGDYSTRILLLLNGHRVNDNVIEQASVGADFGIDAAMFERVEIIRGPASSLYGTNALFAIVNVVTRTGASLNGASFDMDAGTLGTQLARVSAGRRLENGMDFALSGTYERSSGVGRLYLPAFDTPHENSGVAENLDGERSGQVYGRFSMNDLIVTGVFGRRVKDVPTASFFTVFNAHDPIQDTTEARAQVSAEYVRTLGATRLTTGASLDHAKGVGVYPYPNEEPQGPSLSFADNVRGLRWTLNTRAIRPLRGRQTLTLGGEFVDNIRQDQWGGFPFPSDYNFRVERSSRQGGLFVQDEIKLRSWLLVNAGLRHDRFPGFNRTTPRGAVIVMPSANHSLKYLYGRAFRAPNASELYRYGDAIAYLRAESIDTHEWGWEAYFGERVRTSVSTYRYKASQLVERGFTLLNPIFFANTGTVRAAGLELESEIRLKRGAQALTSYTLQDATDDSNRQRLTNSPRHMAKLSPRTVGSLVRVVRVAVPEQPDDPRRDDR